MDFKQLEAFAAVISLGSFSKAGERLFLTQPTISAHVNSLEKELGVRLIMRTTKEVYPSEEGKKFYTYAQNLLQMRSDAVAAMSVSGTSMRGAIPIVASTIPAQYILPETMSEFRKEYPHISFHVTCCDSAEVTRRITDGEAELGMSGSVNESPACSYRDFVDDELVVITPNTEAYRALGQAGFPSDALLKEPFICRESGSGTRKEFERFLEQTGVSPDQLRISAELEDPEAIKRSVSQGLGISILSRRAASDFTKNGLLLSFPLKQGAIERRLYLVTRKKKRPSPEVKAFSDFIMKRYRIGGRAK